MAPWYILPYHVELFYRYALYRAFFRQLPVASVPTLARLASDGVITLFSVSPIGTSTLQLSPSGLIKQLSGSLRILRMEEY